MSRQQAEAWYSSLEHLVDGMEVQIDGTDLGGKSYHLELGHVVAQASDRQPPGVVAVRMWPKSRKDRGEITRKFFIEQLTPSPAYIHTPSERQGLADCQRIALSAGWGRVVSAPAGPKSIEDLKREYEAHNRRLEEARAKLEQGQKQLGIPQLKIQYPTFNLQSDPGLTIPFKVGSPGIDDKLNAIMSKTAGEIEKEIKTKMIEILAKQSRCRWVNEFKSGKDIVLGSKVYDTQERAQFEAKFLEGYTRTVRLIEA